jgi:hypothetical protein
MMLSVCEDYTVTNNEMISVSGMEEDVEERGHDQFEVLS